MNQKSARPQRYVAKLLVAPLALLAFGWPVARAVRPRAINSPAPHQPAPARSSIVVKINPRRVASGPAGDGSARVSLLNGAGEVIQVFPAVVPPYRSIAMGVNGPRRDIQGGDTPFGVYKYTETGGGTAEDRLGKGYGTGKVFVDDYHFSYGEMEEAHPRRYLIRLHGGGSGLPDPYALDQPLRPTVGCVRMKNGDVNTLVQLIKSLPATEPLDYIFMGSDEYLNGLATNQALSSKPWWGELRTALHLPTAPPVATPSPTLLAESLTSRASVASPSAPSAPPAPQDADPALVESVKVFVEDEGEKGRAALARLQPQEQTLQHLQDSLPADSALRTRLAFTLCYLDKASCDAGARVVASALLRPERFSGFYAEEAAQMVSRLIDKSVAEGNEAQAKGLLLALFAASPRADGALSEGLGIAYSEQLRDHTTLFLSSYNSLFSPADAARFQGLGQWDRETLRPLRSKVSELLLSVDHLSLEEFTRIKQKVDALKASSPEYGEALRELRGEYFRRYEQKLQRR